MNPLVAAALEFQAFCATQEWRCCVIGGLAVQRWGEPRQTRDVDLALLTGLGGEPHFIDPLLARYTPRIPEARRFALEHRVLLVEAANRVPLDISLSGLPYETAVQNRATAFTVGPGAALLTCSAEDLVVLKAVAGRAQDWLDIEGVIVRQGSRLNRDLVSAELGPLLELKEDDAAARTLAGLFQKHPS